jgi:ataxia telangiectasia mutated family protein
VEEMLYEIYSHIQEPDGFYGIHDKNAKHTLIRRFEHERQWDKASQVLGAQFEVESLRADTLDGIIKALHFRGFHKQASLTLEAMNPHLHLQASTSASLSYNLGWRTATWDLPIYVREQASDVRLYEALRSVHCERNTVAMNQVCAEALVQEVSLLGEIANEDLYQIEECVQRIICLKEVNDWISKIHPLVEGRKANFEDWREIYVLDGGTRY